MPDVFTKRKRSEVMSRIRGKGNKDTEIALAKLLRAEGITGWRRQGRIRIKVEGGRMRDERGQGQYHRSQAAPNAFGVKLPVPGIPVRQTNIWVDFTFQKERVAVFVDGCFWHGCPKHSSPRRWLRKSSMGKAETTEILRQAQDDKRGKRTGKAFWASKMAGNMARDRFVNRALRRRGWMVVRIWEHDLAKSPARCLHRIRRALVP
jgi:DNA mismatch endonuclease, patch repair protein